MAGWRDPPADVDVVVEELGGQLCAPAERVEVAAAVGGARPSGRMSFLMSGA
jgi:hypothetical protein